MAKRSKRRGRKRNISKGGKIALGIVGVIAAGGAIYGGYRLYKRREGTLALDGVPQRVPTII
jgi:hypothetical protein